MGGPHSSRALRQRPVSEGKLKIYKKEIGAVRTLIFFIFVASQQPMRRGARGELQSPRCLQENRCNDSRLDGLHNGRRDGIAKPKLIRIGTHSSLRAAAYLLISGFKAFQPALFRARP
jgi:hypothetical protein